MLKINSIQSLTLDIIRVFAAQIVLFGHAISFFGINSTMPYIQNMGVVIFFILSGLIISYTLIYKSKEGYSFKEFFIERFARIYSGLIPSLIFIAIIDGMIQLYNPDYYKYSDYDIKTFFANIFMLQDYYYVGHYFEQLVPDSFKITSFGSGRPLWTLAIEWWIYMFMGLIYFFFIKSFNIKYLFILVLVSIVPLINLLHGRGNGLTIFWIFGMIVTLFVFRKCQFSKILSITFAFVFLLFSILVLLYNQQAYNIQFAFFVASFLLFILLYQQNNLKFYKNKFTKIIKFCAGYSFTLYLVHYTIIEVIISLELEYNKYILTVGSVIFANIIAMLMASVTEMKHKKFGEYIKINLKVKNA